MIETHISAPTAGIHTYAGDCPGCGQSILAEYGKVPHVCSTCGHSLRSEKPDSPLYNIKRCLRLYCDTRGRSSRREFWAFTIAALTLLVGETALFLAFYTHHEWPELPVWVWLILPALLACPFTTLTVRRLHDLGKGPGLMISFLLLALAGTAVIVLHHQGIWPELITENASDWAWAALRADIIVGSIILYLATQHRLPGPNEYGPAPK